jgi:hypothetical protein
VAPHSISPASLSTVNLDGEMEVYQDRNGSHEWTLVKRGSLAITQSNVKHA